MPGTDQYLAGLTVLIVEDEPFIALDLAFGVEEAGGVPLGPASSVAQALRLIENELPDAAIVDVDLPRPRTRKALLEHPDYYLYREQVLNFLEEYEHGARPKSQPARPAVAAE